MILVTGATGTVGRQVVEQLVAAGQPVRAVARDPDRADLPDGVELVAGDLSDATGLEPTPPGGRRRLPTLAIPDGRVGAEAGQSAPRHARRARRARRLSVGDSSRPSARWLLARHGGADRSLRP